MAAPEIIHSLVARFADNLDAYRTGKYNETQVRREFVDPFFEALGWDIANRQGYAEAYKDVIHEDSIRVGGGTKAPDYCFRIGGTRKFFLETKKPSVNIKTDTHPAYQLRRYAWSAKLPVSVLTDFEEFAVYDCRLRPSPGDAAATARVMYLTYQDYAPRWDEIAAVFAREAILKGSFDKYAEGTKGKRGTASVDDAFLEEIESWRDALARSLALRNPQLSIHELNFAVQVTIDRIVFLRICEDRKIEPYGRLQALGNGPNVYPRLCELFQRADERYNSGLFHFRPEKDRSSSPDELTPGLAVDDLVLKDILRRLYYPDSPYEFSVLPADILGQVYERFLGKVIRLTAGHQAKIEDKPEVRKAGGVYYTPTYIVEYIVKNTVGKLVEGRKPKDVAALRVLDPACGSGSFLLGAYQFLLDWHRDWYVADGPEKNAKGAKAKLYQSHGGEWKLTTAERRRILLDNIHGVDIDPQAVEVTKLSLLLKVLEGESDQSLSNQMLLFRERALPDIGGNIKCGNSLIGPDFYAGQQLELFNDEARYRINAFDWQAEFPAILAAGGFDAVIGNPPYLGGREWKETNGRQYDYFVTKFAVAEYQFDIYVLFWEKALTLARRGGRVGFITPNTWLNNKGCAKLRRYVLEHSEVDQIADYSRVKVFPDAVVLPIVTVLLKPQVQSASQVTRIYRPDTSGTLQLRREIPRESWQSDENAIFHIDLSLDDLALRKKIEGKSVDLQSLAVVKFGIKLYETGKGIPPQAPSDAVEHIFEARNQVGPDYRPYLEGKDVQRYVIAWKDRWLKYGKNLAAPRDPELFEGERILVRRIVGARLICALTESDFVTSQLLQIVKPFGRPSAKFLMGMLNSSLLAYYFLKKYNRQDKTFPEIRIYELRSLPIHAIDFSNLADRAKHDRMVQLVTAMLALHQQLAAAKTDQDRVRLERQVAATDGEIDRLVYDLYGLSDEEIRIVEGR